MKPPLGLIPKHVWMVQRYWKITEAIERYMNANLPVPVKWVEEYNELVVVIRETLDGDK